MWLFTYVLIKGCLSTNQVGIMSLHIHFRCAYASYCIFDKNWSLRLIVTIFRFKNTVITISASFGVCCLKLTQSEYWHQKLIFMLIFEVVDKCLNFSLKHSTLSQNATFIKRIRHLWLQILSHIQWFEAKHFVPKSLYNYNV